MRLIPVVLILGFAVRFAEAQVGAPLRFSDATTKIEPRVPSGLPVVFELLIPNKTQEPALVKTTGPGNYPRGESFSVTVTDGNGAKQSLVPGNGQYDQGALETSTIAPGDSLRVPLTIDALAPGKYSIQVGPGTDRFGRQVVFSGLKSSRADFEVTDDATLHAQWVADHLPRLRAGDPFAGYLAAWRHVPQLLDPIRDDLTSKDPARMLAAARVFAENWQIKTSPELADALRSALEFRADHPPTTMPTLKDNLCSVLCRAAGNAHGADFDEVLLRLCEDPDFETRDDARMYVSGTNRARATDLFAKGMDDPRWAVRWNTAWHFVSQGDARGVRVFAQFATDADRRPSERQTALQILTHFPNDPLASKTLDSVLHSEDPKERKLAQDAIEARKHAQSGMFP